MVCDIYRYSMVCDILLRVCILGKLFGETVLLCYLGWLRVVILLP